jgi:hypothetical protein
VKKLNVEIEALEFSLSQKSKKNKESVMQKSSKVSNDVKTVKINGLTVKERVHNMHRDRLQMKVNHLLEE